MDNISRNDIDETNTLGIKLRLIPNSKPVKKKLSLTRSLISPPKEHY